MRNRKWTALMLAGVMSLSLMACGENAVNSSESLWRTGTGSNGE